LFFTKDNSQWLGPGGSDEFGYTVWARVVKGWPVVLAIEQRPWIDGGGIHVLKEKVAILDVVLATVPSSWIQPLGQHDGT